MYATILTFLGSIFGHISMITFMVGLCFFAENKKTRSIFGGIAILTSIISLAFSSLSWIIHLSNLNN